MYQKIKAYIPLFLCEFYWNITYIIYRFGVIEWPFKKDNKVLVFVLLCDLFFTLGYLLKKRRNHYDNKKEFQISQQYLDKILLICNGIAILTAIPNSIRYTGYWYPKLFSNIYNAGETYLNMAIQISTNTSVNFIAFFDVFIFCIPPLTMFAWEVLNTKIRIVSVLVSIYYLIVYCSSGRNMPSILFMLSIVITYFIYICSEKKIEKRKLLRNTAIMLASLILGIGMFQINLSSRTFYDKNVEAELQVKNNKNQIENIAKENDYIDSTEKNDLAYSMQENSNIQDKNGEEDNKETENVDNKQNDSQKIYLQYKDLVISEQQAEKCAEVSQIFPMYTNPYTKAYVNVNDPVYKHVPDSLKFIYVMGDQYLCGSYHVLSVALRMDFKWTYGIGFSEFLMDYVQRFTGVNIKNVSYGSRATELTTPSIVSTYGWSTSYVQMAGDVSFVGVIILFGLFGYICSYVWNDAIQYKNAYAVPFIVQMAVFLLAVPANCITFNSGGYFVTFFGTFLLWIFTNRKKGKKIYV